MTRNFFKKGLIKAVVALFVCMVSVAGMHNGLGLTPPMGWNTWNRYYCDIN
jgi:alpha-galactosidase